MKISIDVILAYRNYSSLKDFVQVFGADSSQEEVYVATTKHLVTKHLKNLRNEKLSSNA